MGAGPSSDALTGLVEYVTAPPIAPGFDEILTAGEPERRRMAQRQQDGIPLDDATWEQIEGAAASLEVASYEGVLG